MTAYFPLRRRPSFGKCHCTLVAMLLLALPLAAKLEAHEFTSVAIESRSPSPQTNVPITFGHIFRPGDVPAGTSVNAALSIGTPVPLQVDAKATHADGSLRHAVLTVHLGSLPGNGSAVLRLAEGPGLGGTAVTTAGVLATGYDTTVTVTLSGTAYTASARAAMLAGTTTWLSGALVGEWIAKSPLRTAGGTAHPHLMAYFHVRAYAGTPITRVRTDVVIENNWTLVASPDDFLYDVAIAVPGAPTYTRSALRHWSHARWHRRVWWGAEARVYAKLDNEYLQSTRAIPNYEDVTPTGAYLDGVLREVAPMDNGDHSDHMGDTGFQQGIGPLPLWDALYAVSGDVRAFDYMLANADGGGAYGAHFRDEVTGLPVSIDRFPNSSLAEPQFSTPPIPESSANTYQHDVSHQPSIGYTAYLATGDYFYLEEMQFWSAHNLIATNHVYRNHADGWWYTGSLRGQAWSYRSLAQAAYLTPDAHPMKAYFIDKLTRNIAHDHALYVSPGGPHRNNLGAMYFAGGNENYSFFDYFMSWTVQYVHDLGFTAITPLRDYKLKFPIGLMGTGAGGYCFQLASLYTWKAGPGGSDKYYPDFRTMYEATAPGASAVACGSQAMANYLTANYGQAIPLNGMLNGQNETGYYFSNLQAALAAAADSGLPGGVLAWQRSQLSGVHPDYRNAPIWALQPRNEGAGALLIDGFED